MKQAHAAFAAVNSTHNFNSPTQSFPNINNFNELLNNGLIKTQQSAQNTSLSSVFLAKEINNNLNGSRHNNDNVSTTPNASTNAVSTGNNSVNFNQLNHLNQISEVKII